MHLKPKIFEIFRSSDLAELIGRVAEDGGDAAGIVIGVDESRSVDAIAALPTDGERGIGFFDVDRFALPVSSQPCREPIGGGRAARHRRFWWRTGPADRR